MRLLLWGICTGLGAAIIALPDSGDRLFSLSGEHGPGLMDAIGAAFLLLGFAILAGSLYARRTHLVERLRTNPRWLALLAFTAGIGTGLLLAGVMTDFWWWWLVGAAMLQGFWFALWGLSARPGRG